MCIKLKSIKHYQVEGGGEVLGSLFHKTKKLTRHALMSFTFPAEIFLEHTGEKKKRKKKPKLVGR